MLLPRIEKNLKAAHFFLLLFTLFIFPCFIFAEENVKEKSKTTVCVFLDVDLSETEENSKYENIVTDQVIVELESSGFDVLPRNNMEEVFADSGLSKQELASGANVIHLARQLGADLAFCGFYCVENKMLLLQIKCYNVIREELIGAVLKTGRLNLSIYNLINRAVGEIVPRIQVIKEPAKDIAAARDQVRKITLLSSDEDMTVSLAGERRVGRVSNGRLVLPFIPFKIGSELILEKRKEDYYPDEERVVLEEESLEIELRHLRKQTRLATEIHWTYGQLMGMGIGQRYYIDPDCWFFSGEFYYYIQHSFVENSRPVMHYDLKFLFGGYPLSRVGSRLRLGFSSGIGGIMTSYSAPGIPVNRDIYINICNAWVEWNFSKKWVLFLRSEGKYSLGLENGMLSRGWLMVSGHSPPLTLGLVRKW